jgi:hypothetical protein
MTKNLRKFRSFKKYVAAVRNVVNEELSQLRLERNKGKRTSVVGHQRNARTRACRRVPGATT